MTFFILISIFFFIIGTLFGSFLSVLIHRTLNGQKGIVFGKSRCPKCKHNLKGIDLIPILNWLIKKGKCSYCKKEISPIYPSLELTTGLLFVTNFIMLATNSQFEFFHNFNSLITFGDGVMFWIKLAFLDVITLNLLAIFFSDMQKKAIPNLFLYSFLALSGMAFLLSSSPFPGSITDRLIGLAIGLIFFGGQYLVSKGKWLGSGDIYVGAGLGLLLGWPKLLVTIFLAYTLGSIIIIIILSFKKLKFKQTIPFAPFLVLGGMIALYQGNQIIGWYLQHILLLGVN